MAETEKRTVLQVEASNSSTTDTAYSRGKMGKVELQMLLIHVGH